MKDYEQFENLAEQTLRMVSRCHDNQIHLGEDTLTTIILDSLISANTSFVALEDTRPDESTKGCDFELWVGKNGCGWIRYAVQAKKITPSSGRYNSLKHIVKSSKKLQMDVLESYAIANRAFPIYCFYNITRPPPSVIKPWLNKYKWNCCQSHKEIQLGCSVTPLNVAKKAIDEGARDLKTIHSNDQNLPWRCLVKCHPCEKAKVSINEVSGWGLLDECTYESLPPSLAKIIETGSKDFSFDQVEDLFDKETNLKPSWIGVVDLSKD